MLISSNFASQTKWSIFALDPQMYQATPTHTGLDGASSSMNQVVSEILVPTTATDGGSLIGAVENTDDRWLQIMSRYWECSGCFWGSHITLQRIFMQMT